MKEKGFVKFIVGTDFVQYKLPHSVYTIETNLGQSEVMASAKTAARETKKTFSILITQSLRRSF